MRKKAGDESHKVERRRATLHDVARAADVSIATASKALHGIGRLRPETRSKVRDVAERLGFRPNNLAHSLRRKRSFTVGLLSSDSYGRFSIPILEGIEQALLASRVSVYLCNAANDPEIERLHLDSLMGNRIDGLIVTAARTDRRFAIDPKQLGIPLLHAYAQSTFSDALCLIPDDEAGGRIAAHHLVTAGRRRIAHIAGPEQFESVRLRRDGYRAALQAGGLSPAPGWELCGPWSEAWGREAVSRILTLRGPRPDAIFCGSDLIARGVADALRESGIAVPSDIALVGFDNWEVIAAATRPPLTTIDLNLREFGRTVGATLLGMIEGTVSDSGVRRLPVRLVVRESCGAGIPEA